MGITGNELAVRAAKSAGLKSVVDVRMTFDEHIKAHLRKLVFEVWHVLWFSAVENMFRVDIKAEL